MSDLYMLILHEMFDGTSTVSLQFFLFYLSHINVRGRTSQNEQAKMNAGHEIEDNENHLNMLHDIYLTRYSDGQTN